jgi:hypothetical protein
MAQAMSHAPSNQNLLLHKHVQSFVFKTVLKPRISRILNEQLKKYHPEVNPDDIKWFPSKQWEARIDNAIGIPYSVIKGEQKDISTLHHEITHIKKQHSLKQGLNPFSFVLYHAGLSQSFNNLSKKYEWEADEGTPNDPGKLKEQWLRHEQLNQSLLSTAKNLSREGHKAQADLILKTPLSHPSHKERAARFQERYNRLILGYSVINENERKEKGIPPAIFHPRPRLIARELIEKGHKEYNEDYYADVATDMHPLYKPTNLARYSFSRDKEFLKPRVVRAIE